MSEPSQQAFNFDAETIMAEETTAGFVPGIYDVLLGRGKSHLNNTGNKQFRRKS